MVWEDATGGKINFILNTIISKTNIINIGTGNLAAFGVGSGPGGTLGLGGGVFTHNGNHTITGGITWMDFAENWDEVIGNGNPPGTFDYFTVAVQEIGHALGLGHTNDLPGADLMDGSYVGEQTVASANDIAHIQVVYGIGTPPTTPGITVNPAAPLHAGSELIDGPGHADPLTPEALQSVVQQAIVAWNHEGADPAVFQGLNVQVADLPGTYLGLATGNKVLIDADAAGYGWRLNTSSTTDLWGGSASMDLLTAVRHELAHVLGFDHDDRDAVMAPTLLTDASHLGRSPVDDLSAGLAPLLLPSRQAHDSLFSQFGRGDTSSPAENDVLRSSKQDHVALARFLTLDGNESFLIDRLHANKHDLDGADDDELFDLLLGDSADLRIDAKSAEIEQRL